MEEETRGRHKVKIFPQPILTLEHKDFIAQKVAEYKEQNEIIKLAKEKFGVNVWPSQITLVRKRKEEMIEKLRKRFINDISRVPLAQKRVRLEKVSELMTLADSIKNIPTRINTKLKCLLFVHMEMEGKTVASGNIYHTQINQFSDMNDKDLQSTITRLRTEIINKARDTCAIEQDRRSE